MQPEVERELIRKCRTGDARFYEPLVRAAGRAPGRPGRHRHDWRRQDALDALQEAFRRWTPNIHEERALPGRVSHDDLMRYLDGELPPEERRRVEAALGSTKMMAEAREQAIDRMVEEAQMLGADAAICVRFQTSMVMKGAAEMLCHGTAVKLTRPG